MTYSTKGKDCLTVPKFLKFSPSEQSISFYLRDKLSLSGLFGTWVFMFDSHVFAQSKTIALSLRQGRLDSENTSIIFVSKFSCHERHVDFSLAPIFKICSQEFLVVFIIFLLFSTKVDFVFLSQQHVILILQRFNNNFLAKQHINTKVVIWKLSFHSATNQLIRGTSFL